MHQLREEVAQALGMEKGAYDGYHGHDGAGKARCEALEAAQDKACALIASRHPELRRRGDCGSGPESEGESDDADESDTEEESAEAATTVGAQSAREQLRSEVLHGEVPACPAACRCVRCR